MSKFADLLFGGASGFLSNGINYAFNKMAADHNFKLAEQSAENQYTRQLEFWNMQNAYNTPQAQVNRRLAAGLAPTENVDSGNASQLSSVPGNEVAQSGALNFQSNIDLLDAMRNVQEIRNLGKTGNMLDAQIANAIADGALKELEKSVRAAGLEEMAERLKGIILDNKRKHNENKYLYTSEYYTKQLNMVGETLRKLTADANIAVRDDTYYKDKGIHPDRISPTQRLVVNILDNLLKMVSDKKWGVVDFLNPDEKHLIF